MALLDSATARQTPRESCGRKSTPVSEAKSVTYLTTPKAGSRSGTGCPTHAGQPTAITAAEPAVVGSVRTGGPNRCEDVQQQVSVGNAD